MHALLKAGMDSGEVAPLPWTVYGRGQCQDAFRFLASGAGWGLCYAAACCSFASARPVRQNQAQQLAGQSLTALPFDAAGTHMGKVLVQCGASEEARVGLPAAPRTSAPPLEDAKPAAATEGAEGKAPAEGAAAAAGAGGADGEAAAAVAPESAPAPAEVCAGAPKGQGCCSWGAACACLPASTLSRHCAWKLPMHKLLNNPIHAGQARLYPSQSLPDRQSQPYDSNALCGGAGGVHGAERDAAREAHLRGARRPQLPADRRPGRLWPGARGVAEPARRAAHHPVVQAVRACSCRSVSA